MKSPQTLAEKLTRQWHNPRLREQRLLSAEPWPMALSIGLPGPRVFEDQPQALLNHLQAWRSMPIGDVRWVDKSYRSTQGPISVPKTWRLHRPSEWVQACQDPQVEQDYALLSKLVAHTDKRFHAQLIRDLPRLRELRLADILQLIDIAQTLEPGLAQGKPLRALTLGVDSKFLETHRSLLIRLLDQRFDGAVSELGLESFLDAVTEQDHWLLLAPLQEGLLPFQRLRVRASELSTRPLPAQRILVVENEQCVHQLPNLPDCIAILGAGLDLNWMRAEWLSHKPLAYWGDLDTWGLKMLGQARLQQQHLEPIMMTQATFTAHSQHAVPEPTPCPEPTPPGLNKPEQALFQFLQTQQQGRLEQEFLPQQTVHPALKRWAAKTDNHKGTTS